MKYVLLLAIMISGCAAIDESAAPPQGLKFRYDPESGIKYDPSTISPRGFADYCIHYPTRPECGGK